MKLFKTGDAGNTELRKYVAANVSFVIDNMLPEINAVEENIIIDVLSYAEYNTLANAYGAIPQTLTPAQNKILPICQNIIANLAALMHTPIGTVYFSSMGVAVPQTADTAPASQWRLRDITNKFAYTGFNAIEKLLETLWSAEADYTNWFASTERLNHRELLILTAKQFSSHFYIDDSYQLYCMLKPAMRMVERFYVKPTLGTDLYNEIKSQVKTNTVTNFNKLLLDEYIRPSIASISFFEAAPRLQIDISDFGITTKEIAANEHLKRPASSDLVGKNETKGERDGNLYLTDLREYLFANATTYPLYKSSPAYADRLLESTNILTYGSVLNKPENKVVGIL